MTKRVCLSLCVLLASSAQAKIVPDVKDQPVQVGAARFERHDGHTRGNVTLAGLAFEQMIGIGRWDVIEARDDKGKDLRPTEKSDLAENDTVKMIEPGDTRPGTFELSQLYLAPPSSDAKQVVRLRGTVSYYTGDTPVVITIPHVRSRFGQKISDPALEKAHIQIALDKLDEASPNLVGFEVSGNGFALQDGRVANFHEGVSLSDSKNVDLITSVSMGFGESVIAVSAPRAIDDDMTLRLRVLTHFQRIVVPFELRNVPLPSVTQMKLDDAFIEAADKDYFSGKVDPHVRAKVEELLKQGANINARGTDGRTALYPVVYGGDVELMKFLQSQGINVNLADYYSGFSPLVQALGFADKQKRETDEQSALLLLNTGADANVHQVVGRTPLHMAVSGRTLPVLRLLIEKGAKVDATDDDGSTPLLLAALTGWDEGAAALVDAGADVNIKRSDKSRYVTALMYATASNDLKMVEMLLEHGADPNIANKDGETALIQLRKSNISFDHSVEIARALLTHGADVDARTKDGETAIERAKAKNFSEMIDVLQRAGAKD